MAAGAQRRCISVDRPRLANEFGIAQRDHVPAHPVPGVALDRDQVARIDCFNYSSVQAGIHAPRAAAEQHGVAGRWHPTRPEHVGRVARPVVEVTGERQARDRHAGLAPDPRHKQRAPGLAWPELSAVVAMIVVADLLIGYREDALANRARPRRLRAQQDCRADGRGEPDRAPRTLVCPRPLHGITLHSLSWRSR